jgi:wyosine [tRNA(Phe)-imidazoG37] synthetase (radical SAM superfamily)
MTDNIPSSFVFGPIPSRRLGQSLGVNHLYIKTCTYNCVYCQVGITTDHRQERRQFFDPQDIIRTVEKKINQLHKSKVPVDYISFVPDGEPTLDINLGQMIKAIKPLRIPVAVITNSSMLWRSDVREELSHADLVSVKCDSVIKETWQKINRPHPELVLEAIKEGLIAFSQMFRGLLISETMLVKGINDDKENLEAVARFLPKLRPDKAFIGIATRPPFEDWVKPPNEEALLYAYELFTAENLRTEILSGYSEAPYLLGGDVKEDILSITAVHPMRESEVKELLRQAKSSFQLIEELINKGDLKRIRHRGTNFYVRKLKAAV